MESAKLAVFVWFLSSADSDFFFGSTPMSWEDAQSQCSQRKMRLACPKNESLYTKMKSYLEQEPSRITSAHVWIGLHTTSSNAPYVYVWEDGEEASYFVWNNDRWWLLQEPNNQNTDQCIKIYRYSLTFGTHNCSGKLQFLCEDVVTEGGWSDWITWSECSVTCGNGTQSRNRSCTSPPPSNGGADCTGVDEEYRSCNLQICEDSVTDGGWSSWITWSECSATCGNGTQSRNRSCDSPPPTNGGAECMGTDEEDRSCNMQICEVNGSWSTWSAWSECAPTQCVTHRTRSRSCDSPPPSHGGNDCQGKDQEEESCEHLVCPIEKRLTCTKLSENSITLPELQEKIQDITRTLTVNKTSLSSEVRKKTCAEDPRPSAKYIGVIAVAFIGVYFGLLLLVDCTSLLRWVCSKCK